MTGVSPWLPPDTALSSTGVVQQDDFRCQDRRDPGRRAVLHRAGEFSAAPVRGTARLLPGRDACRGGRRPVRLLHRQHPPDGQPAAPGRAHRVRRDPARPKGPRKATGQLRQRVLELRAAGHSVTEIAAACTAEGTPVSAQTAGRSSTPRACRGCPAATTAAAARGQARTRSRPPPCPLAGPPADLPCDHAGLLLLFPAMTQSACRT